MFSKPAYQCPELLLLALAAVPSEAGGSLRVEMLSRLLPLYFRPNRNTHAAALIRRLWQVNPRLVVQSGVKAFNVDSTLPSVVYVSRDAHSEERMQRMVYPPFATIRFGWLGASF